MQDKLQLLVCQYYLREARAILDEGGFEDVEISSYPDICVHPLADEMEVVQRLCDTAAAEGQMVVLVGACFLLRRGGVFPEEGEHFRVHHEDLCFNMLLPRPLVQQYMQGGSYMVTPGWLEQWPSHIERWQFDRPTAQAFFAESARQILLLDTGVDDQAQERLQACSEFLELPHETVSVGLDHLRLTVSGIVERWRFERQQQRAKVLAEDVNRKLADYVLALDLLVNLTRTMTETEAIAAILELFSMLFAAGKACYAPLTGAELGEVCSTQTAADDAAHMQRWAERFSETDGYVVGDAAFCVRVKVRDQAIGLLAVEQVTFPERITDYLNLALAAVGICGLAITKARETTDRLRAEEALREKSEELARSNEELEQFAYVASHDLQEPLRKISMFGRLLDEQEGASLDAESRDFLKRMLGASERMSRLIEDLLTYSRVGRHARPFAPVDLVRVARTVLDDLGVRLKESGGEVLVDDLPTVMADERQIYQLLLNIIGNGLKFRRKDVAPVVRVSAKRLPGEQVEIRIADNGIGFDTDKAEAIFQPFRRLHTRQAYKGSGIGLAVCKKIVLSHGGRIRAESDPRGGAVFTFSLPAAPPVN